MKGGASYSSPAVAGGLVYMGDWAHNVYCLDAATGAEKWIYTTQAHVNSSPAVANGIVYVGSWDHTVYAFGIQSAATSSSSFSLSSESTYLVVIAIFYRSHYSCNIRSNKTKKKVGGVNIEQEYRINSDSNHGYLKPESNDD